jgi:hypothetical protein
MAAFQMTAAEKEKDDAMRQLFHGVAMRTAGVRGACKVLVQGEIYHLCPACVYKGIPNEEEINQAEDKFVPYDDELPCLTTSELSSFRPEVLLDYGSIPVTQETCPELLTVPEDVFLVPCRKAPSGVPGVVVVKKSTRAQYELLREIPYPEGTFFHTLPVRVVSMPSEISSTLKDFNLTLQDFKAELRRAKLKDFIVLMLRSETSMVYVTTSHMNEPNSLDSVFDPASGITYCGDGWDDKSRSYKNLVKKKGTKKVKGLANPLIGARSAKAAPLPSPKATVEAQPAESIPMGPKADANAAAQAAETKAVPAVPAAALAVEVPDTDAEVNKAMEQASAAPEPAVQGSVAVPQEATAQETAPQEEPVKEEPVQEPKQEDPAQLRKPSRRRKEPAKVGYDFTTVMEYIGAPVDEIKAEDIEKAETEMRNLRDLMIAAARRMANISLKITESSKDAVISMAKVQELLGGRK